jgi:hypothetical protein
MTLKDIEDRVLEHFNYSTDALASDSRSRVRGHVNYWHRRILSRPGMEVLRYGTVTVSSVASTPTVALPNSVEKILKVRDTANRRALDERSLDFYRAVEPDPTAHTGTPCYYVNLGNAFLTAMSAASGIWLVSSSANDAFRAYLEGGSATALKSQVVTLTGTTRVQVGTDVDWRWVGVTLERAGDGVVSVYDAAVAGNLLQTIPAGQTRAFTLQMALIPCPSAALSYSIDVERKLVDLENGSDVPVIPDDYHWLLEQGGKVSEYERTNDDRWGSARKELEIGISELRRFVTGSELAIVPGRSGMIGISRLGGWTPADTWIRR